MKNVLMIVLIIILTPIAIISFSFRKTNFLDEEILPNPIIVSLQLNDQIISLDLEEYLIGVVAAEMPASFEKEALKAQTICARTFAYQKISNNKIIQASTNDQAYITENQMKIKWGSEYDKYYQKIQEVVKETKDIIITYNNQPIKAYYFAMSNGTTETAQTVFQENLPYLQSVISPWETSNRNFNQEKTITKKELTNLLNLATSNFTITNLVYSPTHRLESLTINDKKFSGITIRKLLSLRSTDITITPLNDSYIFQTKGYGHGVGLSQYGANGLAKEGKTYQEILNYYYQDIVLTKINA